VNSHCLQDAVGQYTLMVVLFLKEIRFLINYSFQGKRTKAVDCKSDARTTKPPSLTDVEHLHYQFLVMLFCLLLCLSVYFVIFA